MIDSDTLEAMLQELEEVTRDSQLLVEESVEDLVEEVESEAAPDEALETPQLMVTHYESTMPEQLLYEQESGTTSLRYGAGYDLEGPEESIKSPEVRHTKIEERVQEDIRLVKIHGSAGLRYERNWSSIHEKEAAQWSGIVNSTYNMFLYDIS